MVNRLFLCSEQFLYVVCFRFCGSSFSFSFLISQARGAMPRRRAATTGAGWGGRDSLTQGAVGANDAGQVATETTWPAMFLSVPFYFFALFSFHFLCVLAAPKEYWECVVFQGGLELLFFFTLSTCISVTCITCLHWRMWVNTHIHTHTHTHTYSSKYNVRSPQN
jgi:hypothetical protein